MIEPSALIINSSKDNRVLKALGTEVRVRILELLQNQDEEGLIHVSLCNIDHQKDHQVSVELNGLAPQPVSGKILSSVDMRDHNSFDEPGKVMIVVILEIS